MLTTLKIIAKDTPFYLFAVMVGLVILIGICLWNLILLMPGLFVGVMAFLAVLYPIYRWLRK